ncbi:MAG: HalOD1 output domain-containing protein [Natronomonas sp.]
MDGSGSSVSNRVVWNVAETTGIDQAELPVLYDHIDPDALDSLVEKMSDGEVSFTYAGCDIAVESDGTVRVDERSSPNTGIKEPVGSD